MRVRIIQYQGKVLAHIFSHSAKVKSGVNFLTPDDYTLQLGLITHPKGYKIREHIHNPKIKYKVDTTQEFLYIEKGKVKAKFYNDKFELVRNAILSQGDFLLIVGGGHGFEVLEECRLIEVKQGPYPGLNYKLFREEVT